MIRLKIKALSVNKAWKGRRFKTDDYKMYERAMNCTLPKMQIPTGLLKLTIKFGFYSKAADIDNGLKTFIDCLQKKYDFNDNKIKSLVVDVDNNVKIGGDYIEFKIEALDHAKK